MNESLKNEETRGCYSAKKMIHVGRNLWCKAECQIEARETKSGRTRHLYFKTQDKITQLYMRLYNLAHAW